MRSPRATLLSLVIVSALAAQSLAGSAGQEPLNFLLLDAGARAVALGGAYCALAEDSNALLYNPGGLGRAGHWEATFMHNRHFAGISQEYLGVRTPYGWGASLNYLTYGSVPRTTLSQPGGTGSSYGITDLALGAGYGRMLRNGLGVGAGLKFIQESIDDVSAQGYGLDLGLMATPAAARGITLAASVQNLGPAVRYQGASENLPWLLRLGAAYPFAARGYKALASFDLAKERSEDPVVAFGLEAFPAPAMAVRLGMTTRNDAGPGVTAGAGWIRGGLRFDYAVVPYGDLGLAHRISATMRWGEPREAAPVPAQVAEGSAEEHFNRAEALIQAGQHAMARGELEMGRAKLPEGDKRLLRYHEALGRIAFQLKEFAVAKAHYFEALRIGAQVGMESQHVAGALLGAGLCLVEEKAYSAALPYIERALEAGGGAETSKRAEAELSRVRLLLQTQTPEAAPPPASAQPVVDTPRSPALPAPVDGSQNPPPVAP